MARTRRTSGRVTSRVKWLTIAVHGGAWLLLARLGWDLWHDQLGPDWVGELTRRTGRYAIIFLLLSLTPSVVAALTGYRDVVRVRRALGLYAFTYAALHFLVYIGVDYAFDFTLIPLAVLEGRFILVGFAALVILIPLALTSTRGWVRRLGRNWRRLHRLTYLVSALAVIHYAWTFKEFRIMPLLAGIALFLLLAARVWLRLSRSSSR